MLAFRTISVCEMSLRAVQFSFQIHFHSNLVFTQYIKFLEHWLEKECLESPAHPTAFGGSMYNTACDQRGQL